MNILVDKRLGMLKTSAVAAACLTLMSFLIACGGGAGSANSSGWEKAITPPKLTVISPPVGPTTGGTPVAITGTDIQMGATVVFGNVPAARINSVTSTSIEAVTPVHDPANVDVKVTNPDAGSDTLLAAFTFEGSPLPIGAPPPTISTVLPNYGSVIGGTVVTITGTDFQSGATVTFGQSPATPVVFNNATHLQATTPPHAQEGIVDVIVRNPDGQSATRSHGYTYTSASAPTISSLSIDSGLDLGGTAVTISGTNFSPGATVDFGALPAATVNVVSTTQIDVTTPAQPAGTVVDVIVTNPDTLQGTLPASFRYGTILFSDGFESGDFSKWDYYYQPYAASMSVDSSNVRTGTFSMHQHFAICGVDIPGPTTLSQIVGSHPGNYFVRYTYYTTNGYEGAGHPGQTKASVEQSFTVTAGNDLTVASPTAAMGLTGWNVYISSTSGTEVLQNATPIPIGANWTQNAALQTGTASPPSSDTACGGTAQDNNQAVVRYFDTAHGWPDNNGFQHYFVRGYVRFHVNAGAQTDPQRKLFFISGYSGSTKKFDSVFTTNPGGSLNWRWADQVESGGCTGFVTKGFDTLGTFLLDTWYYVEMENKINDPGLSDGILRIWVAAPGNTPSLILNQTAFDYMIGDPSCGGFPRAFSVGMQANRTGPKTNIVDEDRYWDDVVIADAYVGP
jgi:hypothetical protein